MRRSLTLSLIAACALLTPQVSNADAGPSQMPGTSHWYEVVRVNGGIGWDDANARASAATHNGLPGHLANVTSRQEAEFLDAVSGGGYLQVYIGGRAQILPNSSSSKRIWTFSSGPESGQVLTTCTEIQDSGNCVTRSGAFTLWSAGEPNNANWYPQWGSYGEPCIETAVDALHWNDTRCDLSGGYIVEFEPVLPATPAWVQASSSDASAVVTWAAPDAQAAAASYTVTANPGGASCTTSATSCVVNGLNNRQSYTFTVTASNSYGSAAPSSISNEVTPLAPGFQTWPSSSVLSVGGSTQLRFAQATPAALLTVTGAAKATLTTDSKGSAQLTYSPTKAGVAKFTASYSAVVAGKKTKYSAATQVFVPAVLGPVAKVKVGKTGKFTGQFMPAGSTLSVSFSDGRTITATADSAGKAVLTPVFGSAASAVTFTANVAGVQIRTGVVTVTK